MERRIHGNCPMGCGETLFVGDGGRVTCSLLNCPRPAAADELLAISETEHIAIVDEDSFTIEHPLRERVEGDLHDCQVRHEMSALGGPPAKPGRYRVVPHEVDLDSEPYRPGQMPHFDLEPIR